MVKGKESKQEKWCDYTTESSHIDGEPYLTFVYRIKESNEKFDEIITDIDKRIAEVKGKTIDEIDKSKLKQETKFDERFNEIKKSGIKPSIFCHIPVVSLEILQKLSNSIEPSVPINKSVNETYFNDRKNWLGKPIITETTFYQLQIGNTIFEYSEGKEKTVPKDYKLLQDIKNTDQNLAKIDKIFDKEKKWYYPLWMPFYFIDKNWLFYRFSSLSLAKGMKKNVF